jgi:signal transduction histidine kinase
MIDIRLFFGTIAGAFSLMLGLFVLGRAPRLRLNRQFFLLTLCLSIWNLSGYAMMFLEDHALSLRIYRTMQIASGWILFFLLGFLGEFFRLVRDKGHQRLVRGALTYLCLTTPLYLTSWMVKDFTMVPGDPRTVREIWGVLYPFHMGVMGLILLVIGILIWTQFRKSSGIKRNQMKFILFALGLGTGSLFFYSLKFFWMDLSWIYFPLQTGLVFCFAYAIFKYQLFEFNLWMRRLSIVSVVYLIMVSIPFFFLPIRQWIGDQVVTQWWFMPLGLIMYGILFSLTPSITAFIREKTEQKKWTAFHRQLELVRDTLKSMPEEKTLASPVMARRLLNVLKKFYFEQIHEPVQFIGVFVTDSPRSPIFESHLAPNLSGNPDLEALLSHLDLWPRNHLLNPLTLTAVEQKIRANSDPLLNDSLESVREILESNLIDVCCPCVYEDKLYGFILLGPKEKGIYLPQELLVLQLAASQTAQALRSLSLVKMTQELQNLDALKKDLISNITHEFKSPLAVVEGSVNALLKDLQEGNMEKDKVADYLSMVRDNSTRLTHFIHDLLEVSHLEKARINLQKEKIDLKIILEESRVMFSPLAKQKGLALILSPLESLPVEADPEKLKQVFHNLISNAIKYTDKGHVAVLARRTPEGIQVEIKDTGSGLAASDLPNIFNRFYRSPHINKKDIRGAGLGLAIAKGWVDAHGGRLWAESDGVGKGSTFLVHLERRGQV